jgi:hypothetical protein
MGVEVAVKVVSCSGLEFSYISEGTPTLGTEFFWTVHGFFI